MGCSTVCGRTEPARFSSVPDFLAVMARESARRAAEAKSIEPEGALLARALNTPPSPKLRFSATGFDLIAEVKRRSPSVGRLTDSHAPSFASDWARAYVRGGAAAISVLTEPDRFDGSLADLETVARRVLAPVLRKDFLVEPYQLIEARAARAAGALVVVRIVTDSVLHEMIDAAVQLGLFVLLEAFDERDLERIASALEAKPGTGAATLIGVNSRNLSTLRVDRSRFAELAPRLPQGVPAVAESGLSAPEEVRAVVQGGYRLALVGSALMRAARPSSAVAEMLAAGRAGAEPTTGPRARPGRPSAAERA